MIKAPQMQAHGRVLSWFCNCSAEPWYFRTVCLFYFVRGEDKTGISLMVALVGILIVAAVCGIAAIHFRR